MLLHWIASFLPICRNQFEGTNSFSSMLVQIIVSFRSSLLRHTACRWVWLSQTAGILSYSADCADEQVRADQNERLLLWQNGANAIQASERQGFTQRFAEGLVRAARFPVAMWPSTSMGQRASRTEVERLYEYIKPRVPVSVGCWAQGIEDLVSRVESRRAVELR